MRFLPLSILLQQQHFSTCQQQHRYIKCAEKYAFCAKCEQFYTTFIQLPSGQADSAHIPRQASRKLRATEVMLFLRLCRSNSLRLRPGLSAVATSSTTGFCACDQGCTHSRCDYNSVTKLGCCNMDREGFVVGPWFESGSDTGSAR